MPDLAGNTPPLWCDGFLLRSSRRHTIAAFPAPAASGGAGEELDPGGAHRRATFSSFGNRQRDRDAYAHVLRRRRDSSFFAAAEWADRRATTNSSSGAISGWDSRRGTAQNSMELGLVVSLAPLGDSMPWT